MDQPVVIVGGSISLVGLLSMAVKLLLASNERRQVERDVETKSQLGVIIQRIDGLTETVNQLRERIAVLRERMRHLERASTPSGVHRALKLGDEEEEG